LAPSRNAQRAPRRAQRATRNAQGAGITHLRDVELDYVILDESQGADDHRRSLGRRAKAV